MNDVFCKTAEIIENGIDSNDVDNQAQTLNNMSTSKIQYGVGITESASQARTPHKVCCSTNSEKVYIHSGFDANAWQHTWSLHANIYMESVSEHNVHRLIMKEVATSQG